MIRVVATDVDGTIVGDGSPIIDSGYYEAIQKLTAMGVQVIVATGRHIDSVVRLFEPVKDQLIYICDNGAITGRLGEPLKEERIPNDMYRALLEECASLDECELLITTGGKGYIPRTSSDAFEHLLRDEYRFDVERCDSPETITGVIKFSIYHPTDIRDRAGSMIDRWKEQLYGVVAGACWIDFMMPVVGKGNCLESWLRELGIAAEECAAFGDQLNDLGMLRLAGHSFAVETAVKECQEAAETVIPGWQDNGVLGIWNRIIAQEGEL